MIREIAYPDEFFFKATHGCEGIVGWVAVEEGTESIVGFVTAQVQGSSSSDFVTEQNIVQALLKPSFYYSKNNVSSTPALPSLPCPETTLV